MSLELELLKTFNSAPSWSVLELMLELARRQCQAREISLADAAPGRPVMWGSTCLGYLRQDGFSAELGDWLLSYLTPAWAVLAGLEADQSCWDQSLLATVSILSDLRAGYPMGYSLKVADQMYDLAKAMGKDEQLALSWASTALAANIGYLGISSSIFTKEEISPFDRFKINHHPLIAARLLKNAAILNLDEDVLVHHHEHLDGSGYPRGLKGRSIPDGARALRVVDTYNAMTSPRLYRAPKPADEALDELNRLAGRELDPELTGLYRKVIGF
jgi:HD-GYP domain-containing protein (c-di-GMP phosphodiesterase class II)